MSSGVTGDFGKLAAFQQRINRTIGVPQKVAAVVAPMFTEETRQGFDSKTDPYGGPWKPIKPRTMARGTSSILVRSRALMSAVSALPVGARVRIAFGVPYARFYITTGRGILPKAGRIPDSWKVTIRRETSAAFEAILKGSP